MQNYIVGFNDEEARDRIKALGHKTPKEIFDHLSDTDLCYLNDQSPAPTDLVIFLTLVSYADYIGVNRGLTESEIQELFDIVATDLALESLRREGKVEVVQGPWPPASFFSESERASFQIPPALQDSGEATNGIVM
jgi:hypothetical protein